MALRVTASEAKAGLSGLVSHVEFAGERVIIERRGKPVAALVSMEDLEAIERDGSDASHPQGALALLGAWGDVGDDVIDEMIEHIYDERDQDTGRQVELDA